MTKTIIPIHPVLDAAAPTELKGWVGKDSPWASDITSAVAQFDAAVLTEDPTVKVELLRQVHSEVVRLRQIIKTKTDARRLERLAEGFTAEAFKVGRIVRDPRKDNPLYNA